MLWSDRKILAYLITNFDLNDTFLGSKKRMLHEITCAQIHLDCHPTV